MGRQVGKQGAVCAGEGGGGCGAGWERGRKRGQGGGRAVGGRSAAVRAVEGSGRGQGGEVSPCGPLGELPVLREWSRKQSSGTTRKRSIHLFLGHLTKCTARHPSRTLPYAGLPAAVRSAGGRRAAADGRRQVRAEPAGPHGGGAGGEGACVLVFGDCVAPWVGGAMCVLNPQDLMAVEQVRACVLACVVAFGGLRVPPHHGRRSC